MNLDGRVPAILEPTPTFFVNWRKTAVLTNPFVTRLVRPGAIPFQFKPSESVSVLLNRWRQFGRMGQVLGPHGSGKTTLLHALRDELARSESVRWIQIQKQTIGKSIPWSIEIDEAEYSPAIQVESSAIRRTLIVDGFDCLNWITRAGLIRAARRRSVGLVVSSHREVGLPTLFRTEPTLEEFRLIVTQLTARDRSLIADADIIQAYEQWQPNIREALFQLYDLHEQRR